MIDGLDPTHFPAGQGLALPVTPEAVTWAIRLFLGREPVNEREVALHLGHPDLEALRRALVTTPEFRAFHGDATYGTDQRYAVPPFLLAPLADPALPARKGAPTLRHPGVQLCTAAQLEEPAFAAAITALHDRPRPHRKLWELAYIVAVLEQNGMMKPDRRLLGFGVGRERLPALFASRHMDVLATDAPPEIIHGQGWDDTGQFAGQREDLFYPEIVGRAGFDRRVSFQPVDMNAIPEELSGRFDACWSTCALEHLGSLRHGLDFIRNSLKTLRVGGIAVHTTEFNLSSDDETLESPGLSLYRRRDIEGLLSRLVAEGHSVKPISFDPGDRPLDLVVDLPPYSLPHLKLALDRYVTTSIGIVVRRGR